MAKSKKTLIKETIKLLKKRIEVSQKIIYKSMRMIELLESELKKY